ncbi:MAG: class I SAM-dependent methyltransferase [Polyangia bacterium]
MSESKFQSPNPSSPQSPLATSEPWDLVASAYAAEALPYFEIFARAALTEAALPQGARVVDVAAGPGTLSLLAAAAGARVSAIDFSEPMVAELRARRAAAGLVDAVEARVGDGQQLPFESGAYDAAFSMFGLMFFPDRAAGLREMRRVLKPGARAFVSSWVPFDGPFGAIMKTAAEFLPGMPLGGGAKQPLASPADIEAEMSAAGFSTVTVVTVPQELRAPSFDAFWTAMQRTNAPLVLVQHRLGERWSTVGPQIRERLRATLGDGPLVAGRGAYLGIGVA